MKKSLASKVKQSIPKKKELPPLWEGPESDGDQGGITQSMISTALACKERLRIGTILGLRSAENFRKEIEYGNMWHVAEEALAANKDWQGPLKIHAQKLAKRYSLSQTEVQKWYEVCKRQFPVYVDYWKKHPDVKDRVPLLQEETFKIPYKLPSGRIVFLRGKFDSVDLIGKGSRAGIFLQENKTKGDIDEASLQKNLVFDLQTMFYLVALDTMMKAEPMENSGKRPALRAANGIALSDSPLKGVRYNVIRRPLSGGRGSIRPHAEKRTRNTYTPAETDEHYYDRLLNDYILAEPEYWFMRWTVDVPPSDINRFKVEFLNPFLENLCWWYDLQIGKVTTEANMRDFDPNCLHWRLPFGVFNPIAEGYESDVDNMLRTGSTVGLERAETLFPELEKDE